MTKQTEALEMAIEALPELISTTQNEYERQAEAYNGYPNMAYRYSYLKDIADNGTKALNACKEALAEQPTQEPMIVKQDNGIVLKLGYDDLPNGTPFYTHPPKQWQGLSDDEITRLYVTLRNGSDHKDFARAIEAKLKDKNNG